MRSLLKPEKQNTRNFQNPKNKITTLCASILFFGFLPEKLSTHFRHQGVKISKCHRPIFYSKLTKEHDGSTQNALISTLSRPKTDL
jgi:hypothetical protein